MSDIYDNNLLRLPDPELEQGGPGRRIANKLFGLRGQERYQLWPEVMLRSALSLPGEVARGEISTQLTDPNDWRNYSDTPPEYGPVRTEPGLLDAVGAGGALPRQRSYVAPIVERTQDLANLAVGGILPAVAMRGVAKNTLGSAPVPKAIAAFDNVRPSKDLKKYEGAYEIVEDKVVPVEGLNSRALINASSVRRAQKIENNLKTKDGYWERPLVNERGEVVEGQHRLEAVRNLGVKDIPVTIMRNRLNSGLGDEDGVLPATAPTGQLAQQTKLAPRWYSAVENALESTTMGVAPPDQWAATLKNAKGVKPEELDWLGVQEFLDEKKAAGQKVTRAELQDHIQQNKVEVQEVHKKGEAINEENVGERANQLTDEYIEQWKNQFQLRRGRFPKETEIIAERDRYFDEVALNTAEESLRGGIGGGGQGTKHHEYQLPGGEDYGELLLTLPDKAEGSYYSSHWDEPNPLVHVRYNTRDIDGKKTLFIEEVQSDWHQQGRKEGYVGPEKTPYKVVEVGGGFKIEGPDGRLIGFGGDDPYPSRQHAQSIISTMNRTGMPSRGVPDAPFKKSWPELAMKRMIRYAAENGYDAIAWTPGEVQAARYDLSKQVGEIKYDTKSNRLLVRGLSPDGKTESPVITDKVVKVEQLPDYIGKEVADRLVNKPSDKEGTLHYLFGDGLKVGGEGMLRFYDDQLPIIAGKFAKAHGGKVEQRPLKQELEIIPASGPDGGFNVDNPNNPDLPIQWFKTRKEAEDYAKAPPVHFMELPQSLRDTALQKGFPLFSSGFMLTPVDGNPFEQEPKK